MKFTKRGNDADDDIVNDICDYVHCDNDNDGDS